MWGVGCGVWGVGLFRFSVCGLGFRFGDRLRVGTTRAEDAQGTPTQSHRSPSILVYGNKREKQEYLALGGEHGLVEVDGSHPGPSS